MKNILSILKKYTKGRAGLVTIEWVAIAAVVALASLAITAGIMQSASGLGTAVISNIDTAAEDIAP